MFQVGGYKPGTVIDFEIPKKYGLRQTIADTLGIGGIMRALRTIPVFLDMCRDMDELCPDVTFLNYVNPMAMNTWAINRATKIKTVGLCHSVQGTAEQLAHDIGVPIEEINYVARGHQPHGVLPQVRAGRRRSLSAAPPGGGRGPRARLEPGALRNADAPGLLRHRVDRAFRRVYALVHQARPARPDREVQRAARRVHPPLRDPDGRLGVRPAQDRSPGSQSGRSAADDAGESCRNPDLTPRYIETVLHETADWMRQGPSQPRVWLGDHPQHRDGLAAHRLRQCAQYTA